MSKSEFTALEKTVPIFASVVQPRFRWVEKETEVIQGLTSLPKSSRGKKAEISVPTLRADIPDARAVRIHEMLHARFTPDIQKEASSMVEDGYSEVALQITEDIRLSYIAKRNGVFPENAHFTHETLRGVANCLSHMGHPDLLVSSRIHQTRTAAATIILSMHGHPVEGVDTFDAASCIKAIKGNLGGDAFLRVVDLLGGSPQIETAVQNVFAKAKEMYEDHEIGTNRAALNREREMFREMFSYVHDALESVLYNEPPPPAPSPQEGLEGKDKGGHDGHGVGSEDEGDSNPKDDVRDKEPKSEDHKDAEYEKEKEKEKREAEREVRKASSAQIDTSLLMGETVSREAAAVILAALRRKSTDVVPPSTSRGGFRVDDTDRPNNVDDTLAHVEDINISKDVSNVGWAPMKIIRPNLTRAFKVRVPRRGRPSLDGELPRHWSRWFADRAILDSRGRRPGGTLLIDVSGSMSWSHEQTMKLIESVPAATIAAYSGGWGKGVLTILAHQGRVVAKDDPWIGAHGGQNMCDGPALAWLIRQASPRVWFSDGNVTIPHGHGEVASLAAIVDAQRLLRLGGGWLVSNAQAAIDIFHGKQPQEGSARRSISLDNYPSWHKHLLPYDFWFS